MNRFFSKNSLNRILLDFFLTCLSFVVSFFLFSNLYTEFYKSVVANFTFSINNILTQNILSLILCLLLSNIVFGLYNHKRSYPLRYRLIEHFKSSFFGYIIFIFFEIIFYKAHIIGHAQMGLVTRMRFSQMLGKWKPFSHFCTSYDF